MADQITPPAVAEAATAPDPIDLSALALIGVFSGPEGARALVRQRGGRIDQVTLGDRLREGQVVAIGEDWITLARSGRETVLKMPGA